MKHTKKCRCVNCVTHISDSSTENKVKAMRKIYKRAIIKQLCFIVQKRGRFVGLKYYTRYYRDDEFININDYTHQLIKCKVCRQIQKADVNRRYSCIKCSNERMKHKVSLYLEWDLWSGRAAG